MGVEAGFPVRLSKWENRHDSSLLQIFVALTKKPIPFISQYKHLNALNSTRQKHSNTSRHSYTKSHSLVRPVYDDCQVVLSAFHRRNFWTRCYFKILSLQQNSSCAVLTVYPLFTLKLTEANSFLRALGDTWMSYSILIRGVWRRCLGKSDLIAEAKSLKCLREKNRPESLIASKQNGD